MRKRIRVGWWYAVVVSLLCFVPGAFAQELQINDPPSNNVLDGIYVGSYSANDLTTGGSAQITCDDFKDNSNYNPASYTTNTFSTLGNTLWGNNLQGYGAVAWLTLSMLTQTGKEQGYYSYAIWAIFDPKDVANWLIKYGDSTACTNVFGNSSCTIGTGGGLVGKAEGQTYTASEFSNILILTPNNCTNGPGTCTEQEFLEVVAEGGSAAVYLLLAGLSCFVAMYFRSRRQECAGRCV